MKKSLLGLLVLVVMGLAACSSLNKDAEVNAFVSDMDKLAADIVRTVDENPSDIDKAQQILDSRKGDLKTQFDKLKNIREGQLSTETSKRLIDSVEKNTESVGSLQIKYADKSVDDSKFGEKLRKLSEDYNSIYGA